MRKLADEQLARLEAVLADAYIDLEATADRITNAFDDRIESSEVVQTDTHHIRPENPSDSSSSDRSDADAPHSVCSSSVRKKGGGSPVRVPTNVLTAALPTFMEHYGFMGFVRPNGALDDQKLLAAADMARVEIKVDQTLWGRAHQAIGDRTETALLAAYVFERAFRDGEGRLYEPEGSGGYFRGCVNSAEIDKLNLRASLYSLATITKRERSAQVDADVI